MPFKQSQSRGADSKLSLPGRTELYKLGPPALPLDALGRFDLALVGAEVLHLSAMTHCYSLANMTRQA